jgi:glutamyl-tRNA synthetase
MIITRFAPSPTGYLHIGGLRTALFNYLWAKKNSGKFRLRIEDTDLARNKDEATKAILEAFEWVGMKWDDDVVYQSERFDIYKNYIEQLLEQKKAYKCYLTPSELDEYRKAIQAGEEPPFDIRKYRDFEGELDREYVIRFKAPLDGEIVFEDGVKGKVTHKIQPTDDFVIARSNGVPTYNFVVVVDDHKMDMSHIIRGDDHLSNTFKQIMVYQAFNWEIPKFYHVPMIHNNSGKKLSKRDGAVNVMEYKKEGFLPEAILNFLVRLGWSYGDQEIFTKEEMIELFNPNDINSAPSRYNYEKLLWLNHHYIKNTSNQQLAQLLKDFDIDIQNHDKLEILLDEVKDRAQTLKEMASIIENILTPPTTYNPKAIKKFIKENTKDNLAKFVEFIQDKELHLPVDWHDVIIDEFIPKNNLKPKDIMPPIRICMNGDTKGIDLSALLSILGKEEVISRIRSFI